MMVLGNGRKGTRLHKRMSAQSVLLGGCMKKELVYKSITVMVGTCDDVRRYWNGCGGSRNGWGVVGREREDVVWW